MITGTFNLDDPKTRQYVAEFLDARLSGILGPDWTVLEYVTRRLHDDEQKEIGGLSADHDDSEQE
jgi:hypothetical protein